MDERKAATGEKIPKTIIQTQAMRKGFLAATPVMSTTPVEDTKGMKGMTAKIPVRMVATP